jgi:hypothetical protein
MLNLFIEAENSNNKNHHSKDERNEVDYKIVNHFTKWFTLYLLSICDLGIENYIEKMKQGCESAPNFMNYLILSIEVETEKTDLKIYWRFWEKLAPIIEEMANEIGDHSNDQRRNDDKRKLIRNFLHTDIDWQKIDFERQDIALGKRGILSFCNEAGKNPDVFEALTSLVYYFPTIFFYEGIKILSRLQKEESGKHLLSGINTSFYLERSIHRFLQSSQSGTLARDMFESCFLLLNSIVETGSSRAYYLREHLIRSHKIR